MFFKYKGIISRRETATLVNISYTFLPCLRINRATPGNESAIYKHAKQMRYAMQLEASHSMDLTSWLIKTA